MYLRTKLQSTAITAKSQQKIMGFLISKKKHISENFSVEIMKKILADYTRDNNEHVSQGRSSWSQTHMIQFVQENFNVLKEGRRSSVFIMTLSCVVLEPFTVSQQQCTRTLCRLHCANFVNQLQFHIMWKTIVWYQMRRLFIKHISSPNVVAITTALNTLFMEDCAEKFLLFIFQTILNK